MKVVEKIHKEVVRLETRDLFKNIHSLIPGPLNWGETKRNPIFGHKLKQQPTRVSICHWVSPNEGFFHSIPWDIEGVLWNHLGHCQVKVSMEKLKGKMLVFVVTLSWRIPPSWGREHWISFLVQVEGHEKTYHGMNDSCGRENLERKSDIVSSTDLWLPIAAVIGTKEEEEEEDW